MSVVVGVARGITADCCGEEAGTSDTAAAGASGVGVAGTESSDGGGSGSLVLLLEDVVDDVVVLVVVEVCADWLVVVPSGAVSSLAQPLRAKRAAPARTAISRRMFMREESFRQSLHYWECVSGRHLRQMV
ncbi:hypothetical protein B841_01160 [Corynebacterium maris DSM 45190]|uniref:Uncharacterized protein n=1 Tax=Corynebacterium maris DSM 45190 TaxID=1224163 RepID=S5SZL5_9CORY|nr:hypothetical protein B841_01160 [Corynebacterium maris DSM 45190]